MILDMLEKFISANFYPDIVFLFSVCLIYAVLPFFLIFDFPFKYVSIAGLSILFVLYIISSDFTKFFLEVNYIAYFIFCFLSFLLLVFSRKYFPRNENVDISRFDLSGEVLKAFLAHDKEWGVVLSELQQLKSLDLNKRKDGKYSEKSIKGKKANERIKELDRKDIVYRCEDASFLGGVDKFSIFRMIRELLQNVVFCILVYMLALIVLVQVYFNVPVSIFGITNVPVSIFGIMNVAFISILSFLSVLFTLGTAQDNANKLYKMVRERYVNGQP
jgi:Ca2+/Na+ antiporter